MPFISMCVKDENRLHTRQRSSECQLGVLEYMFFQILEYLYDEPIL